MPQRRCGTRRELVGQYLGSVCLCARLSLSSCGARRRTNATATSRCRDVCSFAAGDARIAIVGLDRRHDRFGHPESASAAIAPPPFAIARAPAANSQEDGSRSPMLKLTRPCSSPQIQVSLTAASGLDPAVFGGLIPAADTARLKRQGSGPAMQDSRGRRRPDRLRRQPRSRRQQAQKTSCVIHEGPGDVKGWGESF